MAGIQIDGVNNKIDFDDDADTSISSASDDVLVVEVGGATKATITSSQATFTQTGDTDVFVIESTSATAETSPDLVLFRNSSSPADADTGGNLIFRGRNDNSQDVDYNSVTAACVDVSDGSESGRLEFATIVAGNSREMMRFQSIGSAGSDTAEVAINEGSADINFRVESDGNANMLKVDAGNNQVLIGGTGATFGELGITGHSNSDANIDMYASVGASVIGKAEIFFSTDSSSDHVSIASIVSQQPSGDQASRKGEILFNVSDNGGPSQALIIQNNGLVSGNLNDTSDANLKKNIQDLETSTDIIKALKPRKFDWKQSSAGSNIAGFVAQEVETVIPDAVVGNDYVATTFYEDGDTIPDGHIIGDVKELGNKGKALNTTAILAHAVKTIQELEARIATLEGN